ncbi:hypothetical protein [Roseobacter sp. S98]|uniref:hypothetical protein n=1 Tax=Roseobacter algicola (ex Choi et al. 2025) (nom. illeg.) TaxID=3092138 RepID=UPI0035C67101
MEDVYAYRLQGRRAVVWIASILMVLVLTMAATQSAPWYIWVVWVPVAAFLLNELIKNPVRGLRLTRDTLILSPWQRPRAVALRDIEKVEFIEWSDSTDMEVHTVSGDVIRVFSGDIPPRGPFIGQLVALGVRVTER